MTTFPGFSHAFQPIVDLATKKIVSYEVLLRGEDGKAPASIYDQIQYEDLLEFEQLNRDRAIATAVGLGLDCSLNLNFMPRSILFEDGRHVRETIATAKKHGLSPSALTLEILESEIIESIDDFLAALDDLRRTGVTIAIDDFGSGYAGLNLLADVQPDMIKLDMHLVEDIHQHGPRQSIVKAIASVCFDLGIDLLAEGVESAAELDFLRSEGITIYQGYYFGKPGFEQLPSVPAEILDV